MRRSRAYLVIFVAAIVSAVLVVSLYQVQAASFKRQQKIIVVAPAKFIAVGQVVREEDVKRLVILKSAFMNGMVRSERAVVGKTAAVALGKNEPILDWKLGQDYSIPKPNEATFLIPRNYILSISNEIRAGDFVDVYASSFGGKSTRLFDGPVVVHAVKTSANQEVTDVPELPLASNFVSNRHALLASRKNASGSIEYVNLNLTESQWLLIDRQCKSGASKLVIAYAERMRGVSP
jgi:hypothetical protein